MIPWLAVAFAEPPEARAETLLFGRTDRAGVPFVAGVTALGLTGVEAGVGYEAYGLVGYPSGLDQVAVGEVFVLAADGTAGPVTWTLGRQPLLLPTWNRRLDGGTARIAVGPRASMDVALGLGSHAGLPGTVGGVPVARLAGTVDTGALRVTLGAWGELGQDLVGHADLAVRWTPEAGELSPRISGTAAVGAGIGDRALERGRLEGSLRPVSGLRTHGWVEHREALVGTELSADILGTLAPNGSDAAGLGAGWSTRNRHRLWTSASVQRWSPAVDASPEDVRTGLVGEVRWDPRCGAERWCLSPGWQGLAGSAGVVHRAGGAVELPLPDAVDVRFTAAWVPWRERHEAWRTSVVAAVGALARPAPGLGVELGGDVFAGAHIPSARGWLALHLGSVPRPIDVGSAR